MIDAIIAASCFIVTVGFCSLMAGGSSQTYSVTVGMHGGGGGGCAALLVGPGGIYITYLSVVDLAPEYYLAFAAMVGSFLAVVLPPSLLYDLAGAASVFALPAKLFRGEIKTVRGRGLPLGLLRRALKVEPPSAPQGGYREAPEWAAYESELALVVERHARRYWALLFLCVALALLVAPAAIYQAFVIGGFNPLAVKVFAVLGVVSSLGLGLAWLTRRQLKRAVAGIPGAVLKARMEC